MALELDPRFTFDAFVVGPANRLAVAAARRVADAPGTTYNPLFIYSPSGLGKTHLLTAIGHQAEKLHDAPVVLQTLEHMMDEISTAVQAGDQDAFRGRIQEAGVLLLDDVQFVAGHRQTQDELIRAWDALSSRGAQVVLTSDRPPQEIDGLDDRLLSRLSGGLIVDMSAPDYETRVAIARRKAEERGRPLSQDVCQAVGRIAFTNVRELQGALNRLIAVQELEDRTVEADEVDELLGVAAERGPDEFGEFLSDITGTVSTVVEEAEQLVGDAILSWEGEGYQTRRLDSALKGALNVEQAEELIRRFEHDVNRLRKIRKEIGELEPDAEELESRALRDPDRVAEAESLLARVRERQKPPPEPPPGPDLDALSGESLALRAARAVAEAPGEEYNPLYVMGPDGVGKSTLLVAVGNTLLAQGLRVAYLDTDDFAEELIDALEHSRLDVWRARFRRADAFLIDGLDAFAELERAQDELFHLFEDLYRDGGQLVFAATAAPQDLSLPERLQSRLESGLVVELAPGDIVHPDAEAVEDAEDAEVVEWSPETDLMPETEPGAEPEEAEAEEPEAREAEAEAEAAEAADAADAAEAAEAAEEDAAEKPEASEEAPELSGMPELAHGPGRELPALERFGMVWPEGEEPEIDVADIEVEDAEAGEDSEAGEAGAEATGKGKAEDRGQKAEAVQREWSREKVLWRWPYASDWIEEELD